MPVTVEQHEKSLENPALCEQLPVRDYLDNVMVRTNGALVAGYEVRGITSYFASDEERDRNKVMLGALLKSIPEQSMRVQARYEVVEDVGNLLEVYTAQDRSDRDIGCALDTARLEAWRAKAEAGHYLRPLLHVYLIWDPRVHHRVTGKATRRTLTWNLSSRTSIERSRREHKEVLAEFESLLVGIEATMQAADLGPRRLTDQEMFLEAKRALNPLEADTRAYTPGEDHIEYRSARQQLANVSIVDETDSYLNLNGLLYSLVSLKELPDATFPGTLRELVALDFPIVVSAQLTIPDQTKVLKGYKTRLRKMQAAQRDTHGGFRVNVEAQVAESQLFKVQQEIIASSIKTAKLSLVIATRTSKPAITRSEFEDAERLINNRRQQLLYAVARMNGAKAITETLAKRRLFFSSLPGMAELLPVRDSKKERLAYEAQVNEDDSPTVFGPNREEEGSDEVGRIA
jgi:type IV secretory pathway VirB4 component